MDISEVTGIIAQILASILGFSAVFLTLRLDALTKDINAKKFLALKLLEIRQGRENGYEAPPVSKQSAHNVLNELKSYYSKYSNNGYNDSEKGGMSLLIIPLRQEYDPTSQADSGRFMNSVVSDFDSLVERRDNSIKLAKYPGLITAATIAVCILFLGISVLQVPYPCVLYVVFLGIVFISLLSLYSMVRAAWKLVSDDY